MFNGFPFGGGQFHSAGGHGGHGGGRAAKREVDNVKFYEMLSIERTATEVEIKKAYRKAAMTHHPDKGGDPEKFKEISKAYEVLSDKEKRALYDEGGEEALQDGGSGGGAGGMDIFDLFGGAFGGGGRRGPRKGEDVVFPLKVTLDDLYNGTSKKLRLTKNILCKDCKGKGGKGEVTCKDCKGQGIKLVIRQLGPGMIQQMQAQCSACKGTGSQIAEKDKCKSCHGEKTVKEKKTLEVFVSKGMKNGEKITFSGEADEAPDTIPGDVIVVLQQQEHPYFRREGMNLFYKKTITLLEALTSFSFNITHLDGRSLLVKSEEGSVVKPGDFKCIKNEGFPSKGNAFNKGNLYVEFDVTFPAKGEHTAEHKKALGLVLPAAPASVADVPMNGDVEEVELHSVDMDAERRKFQEQAREAASHARHHGGEDEDDDDDRRHGPGCRAQ